jgi:outer membrane protein
MMKTILALALSAVFASASAHAADNTEWVFKVGVHNVDPKSDNGSLAGGTLKADVGSDVRPTVTAEYLFTPNWGAEVLASLPFQHDIKLNGVKAADVKHLPPTVSLQYHFNPEASISPFVGLGLNYTLFFSKHTTGPLAGTRLDVSNTLGPAAHAGVDFRVNERCLVTLDLRWMKIDPDVKVNGAKVGTVHIDPLAYGVAVGYRF